MVKHLSRTLWIALPPTKFKKKGDRLSAKFSLIYADYFVIDTVFAMKFIQKFIRIFVCCVCALLIPFNFLAISASAAQSTSEFDFSSTDSIDAYDKYNLTQIETDEGEVIDCVNARILNEVPSSANSLSTDYYRHGAYLRNTEERQKYYFYNLEWNLNNTTICYNTLTIYADPEVRFEVTDQGGNPVINSDGVQDQSLVQYYKKSTDYGHTVYFIELTPRGTDASRYIVTFWTDSTNTQPHYSFWFGAPLTRKANATIGYFNLSVSAPSKASVSYNLKASYLPERAWVNKAMINKVSSTGDANVSNASIKVAFPGPTSGLPVVAEGVRPSEVEFDATPCMAGSNNARGTYQVYLCYVSWKTSYTGTYQYRGTLSVEYLYAFGA